MEKSTNTIAAIQTIGWIITVFEPDILEQVETENFYDKLKTQLANLENDSGECFSAEKMVELKEAISKFIEATEKLQKMQSFEKYFYKSFLLKSKKAKRAKKIFDTANKLLLDSGWSNN